MTEEAKVNKLDPFSGISDLHTRLTLRRMQGEIDNFRAELTKLNTQAPSQSKPANTEPVSTATSDWTATFDFDRLEYSEGYNHLSGAWVRKSTDPHYASKPWWWSASEDGECSDKDMARTLEEAQQLATAFYNAQLHAQPHPAPKSERPSRPALHVRALPPRGPDCAPECKQELGHRGVCDDLALPQSEIENLSREIAALKIQLREAELTAEEYKQERDAARAEIAFLQNTLLASNL